MLEGNNNEMQNNIDISTSNTTSINTELNNNMSSFEENKKNNKILPICLIIIAVICLGLGSIFYYLSSPKKIVFSVINKSYEKYDKLVNNTIDFDITKDSIKVNGDLNIDTNISGFEDINQDVIKYSSGIDYKNKKVEGGISLNENNVTLAEVMAYLVDDTLYMSLGDDYKGLINMGNSNFNEIIDLDDLNNNYTKDDINYVVKAYKDILIDCINSKDLTKGTDTISIDGKDVKVNKVTYIIDSKVLKELNNNITDKVLNNKELLNRLAKISGKKVDDIKESLTDSKKDFNVSDDVKYTLDIYTKGITNSFVGIKLSDDNSLINVIVNKDNTKITLKNSDDLAIVFTVNEYSDEKIDLDYDIDYFDEKISGNFKISNKEVKKNNYKGLIELSFKYNENNASVKINYNMEIGSKIADVDTNSAVSYDQASNDLMTAITNITTRLESSNIGSIINYFVMSSSSSISDTNYDYDFSY